METKGGAMSESEPPEQIRDPARVDATARVFRNEASSPARSASHTADLSPVVTFDHRELREILNLYGRMVAQGEWRDYAIDFLRDRAVFSVFRRTAEVPLYRIEKQPALARKQGAYCVVTPTGLILKRGPELSRVLRVLDKLKLVVS
jgi:hypothetical protein